MHGPGVAGCVDSIEEDLTAAIRPLLGPDVKLAMTLDHPANLADAVLKTMHFIAIVRLYPHTAMHPSSCRGATMRIDMIEGRTKP